MRRYTVILVLLLFAILHQKSGGVKIEPKEEWSKENYLENEKEKCFNINMWFVPGENGTCHCGSELDGIIHCDTETKELAMLLVYCLTPFEGKMVPVVGKCIFNSANISSQELFYRPAPSNCQYLNRQGTLCGRCFDGYAVPAYSYDLKCMKCDSNFRNLLLYITYAFLPLTLFITAVLVLRINVVAPKLYYFVLTAQVFASPVYLRVAFMRSIYKIPIYVRIVIHFIASVYGIWNLDFFRVDVLPPVCFDIIPLHTLALDYLVALYPMLLMGVAYIIVEVYSLGYRPLLYLWRPFHRFFARFRRTWGIQTSIMDAFVTFYVLSSTKLFTVSFAFLIGTRLYTSYGQYSWYLYYDPSIKYFSTAHLPYILIALSVLFFFFIFPLLLLLFYQFRTCRKCLIKCRLSGPVLDMYVHSFQQYYKDGSNGTSDCRWFSGFFLILRLAAYATYGSSRDGTSYMLLSSVFIIASIVPLVVQPFKQEYDLFNVLSTNTFLLVALVFATITKEQLFEMFKLPLQDYYFSTMVLGLLPLMYITGIVVCHFYKRWCSAHFNEAFGRVAVNSLPHRILHSDQYRDSFGFISAAPSIPDIATQ